MGNLTQITKDILPLELTLVITSSGEWLIKATKDEVSLTNLTSSSASLEFSFDAYKEWREDG